MDTYIFIYTCAYINIFIYVYLEMSYEELAHVTMEAKKPLCKLEIQESQ